MNDDKHGDICHACGGMVGADGYALGGEVNEGFELEQHQPVELDQSEQHDNTVAMREMGMADAIRRNRSMPSINPPNMAKEEGPMVSDMERKKREKYGFMKRGA